MDERYRVYGPLKGFKHRVDIGSGDTDFITVGKLDFSYFGPYNYKTQGISFFKIFRDFSIL